MIDISEQEKSIIDKKIKNYTCPFCGGKIMHLTRPIILLHIGNNAHEEWDIDKALPCKYLSGECQECGYTTLRNLDILLNGKGGVK